MWMRFQMGDKIHDVPILGIGGTVRVAVGEVGARSSVWRIWANAKTSDVYVAARTVAGEQKFSFHQSGDWRYAWTYEAAQRNPETIGPSRVKDRWRRPDADGAGWTPAMSIWVRHQDVPVDLPDNTKEDDVIWVPRPPEGYAAGIHLALIAPDGGWEEFSAASGYRLLEVLRLANDEALAVWSNMRAVSTDEAALLEEGRRRAFVALPGLTELTHPGMRIAQFTNSEAGHRMVWDTALNPDPPASE